MITEVRDFLKGLRGELPELFPVPRPAPRARPDELRAVFEARVAHWAALMAVSPRRVFIKDQRTRWGSCSEQGNLNFNWRLTLAPPEVLDYVVIHELAHLVEMNHGKGFWTLVCRWCPEHKTRRRWLRQNGKMLYAPRRPKGDEVESPPARGAFIPSGVNDSTSTGLEARDSRSRRLRELPL